MSRMAIAKIFFLLILQFSTVACSCFAQQHNKLATKKRPNILLILADDMGFSDLGAMGSAIKTPAIDKLMANGISFSNFYNTGRCCPSRAALLTGQYPHKVGMGWMTAADLGTAGYTGDLDTNSSTIAEVLTKAKYHCYIAGKWHVTANKFINDTASKHNWPLQRGFEKYYGILSGGDSYYIPNDLVSDNHLIAPPKDFYLTNAITDAALTFMQGHILNEVQDPFFCYVAYTTPHRPLHALKEDIQKYKGSFKAGWDELRLQKSKYLIAKGWINAGTIIAKKDNRIPDWNEVAETHKLTWQARMEVYAAQIDNMDKGIAKIIAMLQKHNQLDNTLIIFLSDNGGNEEMEGNEMPRMLLADIENLGEEKPRYSYNREWAQVSNAPFRSYKSNIYEGGIASPLIVHWPGHIKKRGVITNQISHIVDIMPTLLAAAGIKYKAADGINLLPALLGNKIDRKAIYFEHETACGIRLGDWKLVSPKASKAPYFPVWELYNLKTDRTENHNVASNHPQLVKQLAANWNHWAKTTKVYPLDGRGWWEKVKQSN